MKILGVLFSMFNHVSQFSEIRVQSRSKSSDAAAAAENVLPPNFFLPTLDEATFVVSWLLKFKAPSSSSSKTALLVDIH